MWELCSDVRSAFRYSTYCFIKCYDIFIKFFDSWYGVWNCVEVVCYARAYDCICHVDFLFHSGWACYEGLTLVDYFRCSSIYLCFPFE